MKNFKKRFLISFLGLSNLAVLTLVFGLYFSSHQGFHMLSMGENLEDLHQKIEENCKDQLQALSRGERDHFVCSVKIKQYQAGASYILKTKVIVTKNEKGELLFEGSGVMKDRTRHATEADFCNACTDKTSLSAGNLSEILDQVADMTESIYIKAEIAVDTAQRDFYQRDRARRMAKIKEGLCEGVWLEATKTFEEFEAHERLECKIGKLGEIDLALDVEDYYHEDLKKDLWKLALSEDDYLLNEETFDTLRDHSQHLWSVQLSSKLLKKYLDWKEDFKVLSEKKKPGYLGFINQEIKDSLSLMEKEQAQTDYYYLNQAFDGMLVQLNQAAETLSGSSRHFLNSPPEIEAASIESAVIVPVSTDNGSSINYEEVKKETQHLY